METERFIDLYEVLQVSPNADPETIHRVYRLLAQRHHPDNADTGDEECFKLLLAAYHILGDPERRAAYDVHHQSAAKRRWKIFDQPKAAQGAEGEKRKRHGVLSLLYTKRMNAPLEPSLTLMELEDLLGCPREHLEFSLWYLKESQSIQRTDNGRYQITVGGVDALEQLNQGRRDESRLLPEPEKPEPREAPGPWMTGLHPFGAA